MTIIKFQEFYASSLITIRMIWALIKKPNWIRQKSAPDYEELIHNQGGLRNQPD